MLQKMRGGGLSLVHARSSSAARRLLAQATQTNGSTVLLFILGLSILIVTHISDTAELWRLYRPHGMQSEQRDRPALFAVTNVEGLNAQTFTLMGYLRVAEAAERELVLIPFVSKHYKHTDGSLALIRMEDYYDNTAAGCGANIATNTTCWRTADPFADKEEPGIEMVDDVSNNCAHGKFGPGRTPSLPAVLGDIRTMYGSNKDACIKGRVVIPNHRLKNSKIVSLHSSALVIEIAERAMQNLLLAKSGGNGDERSGSKTLSAVHLRRGDKCFNNSAIARCGPVRQLAFIDLCRQTTLYVATNEKDPTFIEDLRQAGCLTYADIGLDMTDEANKANEERGGRWNSVLPNGLAVMVDGMIVKSADVSYSFGCTSFIYEQMMYRRSKGLGEVMMYRASVGAFVNANEPGLKMNKCDQQ